MSNKTLTVLYGGSTAVDKGAVLTYRVDVGKKFEVAFLAYLIKTDKGNILFDSGIDHDDIPYLLSTGRHLNIKKEDHLLTRLKEVGVSPEEIDFIFQSHLHWDHSGLLKYFPKAQIIIQREEYSFAQTAPAFAEAFYRRRNYDSPDLNWRIIDGDEILMPGIAAIFTPGHTPGHQSLLVELPESGTIILCGDSGYIIENLEKEIIPAVFFNPVQALHSLKRLNTLAKITNGQIITSHDIEQLKTTKRPPDFYK